jgi:hypothetical protein
MVVHYKETRGTSTGRPTCTGRYSELKWVADYGRCHPDKDTFVAGSATAISTTATSAAPETSNRPDVQADQVQARTRSHGFCCRYDGSLCGFKGEDESVSALCLNTALSLWDMTFANQDALDGITVRGIPEGDKFYRSVDQSPYFWAATMLFKATGDLKYRDEALFYAMARM